MRLHLHFLSLVLLISMSLSFAQSNESNNLETVSFRQKGQYLNIGVNIPAFSLHYGLENLFTDNSDLRFRVAIQPFFGTTSFNGGLDALFTVGDFAGQNVYAGLGIGASSHSLFSGAPSINFSGTLGFERPLSKTVSLMSETSFGASYAIHSQRQEHELSPHIRGFLGLKFKL